MLSQVIAEAFCDLPPSAWLIADRDCPPPVFPDYFRIYVEHALAGGIVTPPRTATPPRCGSPSASSRPARPPDYADRLRAATIALDQDRFLTFDAALDRRHPAARRTTTWPS